jgi:hypothetical protein
MSTFFVLTPHVVRSSLIVKLPGRIMRYIHTLQLVRLSCLKMFSVQQIIASKDKIVD